MTDRSHGSARTRGWAKSPGGDLSADDLWNFSLRLYGQAGVEHACLSLQQRRGLDVNLLMLCCWLADKRQALDPVQARQLCTIGARWQKDVTGALRQARRSLKHWSPADSSCPTRVTKLRTRILEVELEAERAEQGELIASLGDLRHSDEPPEAVALQNLAMVVHPRVEDIDDLATLLCAMVPWVNMPEILAAVGAAVDEGVL